MKISALSEIFTCCFCELLIFVFYHLRVYVIVCKISVINFNYDEGSDWFFWSELNKRQDRQRMYKRKMGSLIATIVAAEKQLVLLILSVCLYP